MTDLTTAEKDALYSIMNREDLNWRKLNLQTAVKTINQMPDCQSAKAFVLDFLPLAWAGMLKTSFRKNSDSPQHC
jgi:hypothetical protein